MATNIEIKARARDFESQFQIASTLCPRPVEVIAQEDIFFNVSRGRLKLRVFSDHEAELIAYARSDELGPTASEYEISRTHDPSGLRSILERSLGVRGIVRKSRQLLLSGRTRIHFDTVDGLGRFIELEVVLADGDDPADGAAEADNLMATLGIQDEDLIRMAYVDLLEHAGTDAAPR